ncbi:hypothetical protein NQZ68_013209 [Dissostichus eleginoides]|nr:hypothetical protein NQZ68_013209 [Dissostichus eleginoides]
MSNELPEDGPVPTDTGPATVLSRPSIPAPRGCAINAMTSEAPCTHSESNFPNHCPPPPPPVAANHPATTMNTDPFKDLIVKPQTNQTPNLSHFFQGAN